MDPANPELRLAIEIYLDHIFVALARADLEQALDAPGDGFHGFAVQLRPQWLAQASHISARIANQGSWLDGSLKLPASPTNLPAPIATQVWYNGGLKLKGWAWDPDSPTRHVGIRVYQGQNLLLNGLADQLHPALAYRSTADHGFDLDIPWELADGQTHQLRVETDMGTPLTGGPITLCLHPEGFETLLRRLWPIQETSQPPLPLLTRLAHTQDQQFPRSAGFTHYPQWHAIYQQAPVHQHTPGQVLVLLIGEDTPENEAVSIASIQQQRLPAAQILTLAPKPEDLISALKQHTPAAQIVVPLQRGDRLAPHALDTLLSHLATSHAAWAYADCDQDTANGERSNPWFKPGWDETLFYGTDLVTPGSAFTAATVLTALQAQNRQPNQASWHHLLASIVHSTQGAIHHLPQVLYHRNAKAPASPHQSLPDATRQAAVQWLAQQRMPGAHLEMVPHYPGLNRVHWSLPAQLPRISLIIPTRDQLQLLRPCIEGLLNGTDYPNLEIIVVDNDSRGPETRVYLAEIAQQGVRVLSYPQPFNYSAINNWAIEAATGEIIGLINNDIEVIEPGWLKEMLSHLLRPSIGAVGAKLLWPNSMVQHGGVVVGINGLAAHTGNTHHRNDPGYLGYNQLARQQSAVTAACLLVRKYDYQLLGGLDETRFPVAFNDVDFCLRLGQAGKTLVWTPFAQLIHAESASRGKEDTPAKGARAGREQMHFVQRWNCLAEQGDIYYHPCLSTDHLVGPYGGLAIPPRSTQARNAQTPRNS